MGRSAQEVFGYAVDLRIIAASIFVVGVGLALTVRRLLRRFVWFLVVTVGLGGGAALPITAYVDRLGSSSVADVLPAGCEGSASADEYHIGTGSSIWVCSRNDGFELRSHIADDVLKGGLAALGLPTSIPVFRTPGGWEGQITAIGGMLTVRISGSQVNIGRTGDQAFDLSMPATALPDG
jgi:hypothetical protein